MMGSRNPSLRTSTGWIVARIDVAAATQESRERALSRAKRMCSWMTAVRAMVQATKSSHDSPGVTTGRAGRLLMNAVMRLSSRENSFQNAGVSVAPSLSQYVVHGDR